MPSADCGSAFAKKLYRSLELRTGVGNRGGGGQAYLSFEFGDGDRDQPDQRHVNRDGLFAESLMAGRVQSDPEVVAGLDDFRQKKSWRLEVTDRSDVIDATRVYNWQVCIGVRWVRDIGKT